MWDIPASEAKRGALLWGKRYESYYVVRPPKSCVVNITQMQTIDRANLRGRIGPLPRALLRRVWEGVACTVRTRRRLISRPVPMRPHRWSGGVPFAGWRRRPPAVRTGLRTALARRSARSPRFRSSRTRPRRPRPRPFPGCMVLGAISCRLRGIETCSDLRLTASALFGDCALGFAHAVGFLLLSARC